MKIKYLAHSSFLVTTESGTRILFDPYSPGAYSGSMRYGAIRDAADIVVASHEHPDHGGTDSIAGNPVVIHGLQLMKSAPRAIKDITLRAVPTLHDQSGGKERGENALLILEADGMRLCHAGDLGHVLTDEQVRQAGDIQILLLPVGGHFTIDAAEATRVMEQLSPQITIPMHYKTPDIDFPIGPVDDFLAGKSNVRRTDSSELTLPGPDALPATPEVVVLKHSL